MEVGSEQYLTATIQETLRLRPVIVLVIRRLTEAVEIGGYELPAGASVTPCIHLVHRDPEIYSEPERFLPERFIDQPAWDLHLDSVWWRYPPLPGRIVRAI